jgi:hypothetical protein
MYRLIVISCLLLLSAASIAQSKWNYGHTDSVTYRLYKKGSWVKIIKYSNYALEANTDFYYLRIRRGMAFYNLENYRKASVEFNKALQFFPIDTFSKKMLYFSYLQTGDQLTARKIASTLPEETKQYIGYNKSAFQEVGLFFGFSTFDLEKRLNSFVRTDTSLIFDVSGNKSNHFIGFYGQHRIKNFIEMTHNIVYFNVVGYHYINNNIEILKYKNKGTQFSYSNITEINLKNQLLLLPNFQYFHTNAADARKYAANITRTFTVKVPNKFPNPPGTHDSIVHQTIKMGRDTSTQVITNYFQFGFGVSKRYKNFDMLLKAYYAKDDTSVIKQFSAGGLWSPKGNLNTYIGAYFSVTNYKNQSNSLILVKAGQRVLKKLWVESEYSAGNFQYFTHPVTSTAYLTNDRTKQVLSANLIFLATTHLKFTATYTYISRLAVGRLISNRKEIAPVQIVYPYIANQFLITTSWIF